MATAKPKEKAKKTAGGENCTHPEKALTGQVLRDGVVHSAYVCPDCGHAEQVSS